jgi:CDP-diglyceride synthetase
MRFRLALHTFIFLPACLILMVIGFAAMIYYSAFNDDLSKFIIGLVLGWGAVLIAEWGRRDCNRMIRKIKERTDSAQDRNSHGR